MKAKKVYEAIEDVLKPKSKEEIAVAKIELKVEVDKAKRMLKMDGMKFKQYNHNDGSVELQVFDEDGYITYQLIYYGHWNLYNGDGDFKNKAKKFEDLKW